MMIDNMTGAGRFRLFHTLVFFFTVTLISGCAIAPELRSRMENTVSEAQKHVEVVKNLGAEKVYPDNFVKAKQDADNAKNYFDKKDWKKVLPAAENSLNISRQILKSYYLDEVAKKAEELKKKFEKEDADSPLKAYLPELNTILDFAEELEKGEEVASIDKVLSSMDKVLKAKHGDETSTNETVESDISFDLGKYNLSEKGVLRLDESLEKILEKKDEYKRQYPDSTVIAKITVTGYTDQVGFNEKAILFKELIRGAEDELPPKHTPEERRRFLNKRLSEFRARTIGEYIKQFILKSEEANPQFKVDLEIKGYGEEIYEDIPPPYPSNDSRRRFCKFYIAYNLYDIKQ